MSNSRTPKAELVMTIASGGAVFSNAQRKPSATPAMGLRPYTNWIQFVYGLNPMAGVAEGFRWALLNTAPPEAIVITSSAFGVLLLLIGGLYYFKRMERTFADVV